MTTIPYVACCSACGARPFVDPTGFTLMRFDPSGHPTSNPDGGELFCESHYPPRTGALRPPVQTPLKALAQFEREFTDLTVRLEMAVAFDMAENNRADLYGAFAAYRDEIKRSLAEVRKAPAARELPPDQDVGKPKRPARKRITSAERHHEEQGELLATSLVANTEDDVS